MKDYLKVRADVGDALNRGQPVIALESTIIAHGMPYPRNIETALEIEALARSRGVVPATVAIIDGTVRIGLSEGEIRDLALRKDVLKVSRKDFSYTLAAKKRGATTVSATMIAADAAGIRVFATGGIGGVHRDAWKRRDISADLSELAQTPVIVVSAGAKAILDLPGTTEFLETQGVPILGYRTDEFPAFFSRSSGIRTELRVESASEIAEIFQIHRSLGFGQGILVANPIPEQDEIPATVIDGYLARALEEQERQGISGKLVTPFLLSMILKYSGGATLAANVSLLKNNVELACEIARSLS